MVTPLRVQEGTRKGVDVRFRRRFNLLLIFHIVTESRLIGARRYRRRALL
jgi:hypothetical protein